jgi:hypothetical protein
MQISTAFVAFACVVCLAAKSANADDANPAATPTPAATTQSDSTDATTTRDVRCAVVFLQSLAAMQPSATKDDAKMNAVLAGAMYWLGRLDGRTPNLDLEHRLIAEEDSMTPEIRQAEAERCGAELAARGKMMTEIGDDMSKMGK